MKKILPALSFLFFAFTLSAQFIEIDKGQNPVFQPEFNPSTIDISVTPDVPSAIPPTVGDVDPFLAAHLQYVLDSMTADLGAVGLSASLILPDGNVWNGASGIHNLIDSPITTDMRLGMGSVSKSMTAAVTMQLVEEGILSLDDTLGKWLPQYPNVDLGIPIRMLLNHTSGIYNFTNNPAFATYLNQNLSAFIDAETVMNTWVDTPYFAPGTSWEYSNTNYVLLGLIIESATGNEYHEEVRTRLIEPNGLNSMYLHPQELPTGPVSNLWIDLTGDGVANDYTSFGLSDVGLFSGAWAAGAYMTTAEDLAHWVKYLMTGQVVSQATLDEMMDTYAVSPNFHYGLGIYNLALNGNQWWGHDGYIYYQTLAMYSPDLDVSMVLMCNDGVFEDMGLLYFSLVQAYLNFEPVASGESLPSATDLTIFPNPVQDQISIMLDAELPVEGELKITNELGQQVFYKTIEKQGGAAVISIDDCSHWPNGVYSVHFSNGEQAAVKRFVKQQ